jgi:hypothetical protein
MTRPNEDPSGLLPLKIRQKRMCQEITRSEKTFSENIRMGDAILKNLA